MAVALPPGVVAPPRRPHLSEADIRMSRKPSTRRRTRFRETVVRFVTMTLVGLPAAFMAGAVETAAAAERLTFRAGVSVSGQVTVTFHGDREAGCEATFRCEVQTGTIRWTPRSEGQLSVFGVPGRRLTGYLSLFGGPETTL